MTALAQIFLRYLAHKVFNFSFSKVHNSEEGHNSEVKKYGSTIFLVRILTLSTYEPFSDMLGQK